MLKIKLKEKARIIEYGILSLGDNLTFSFLLNPNCNIRNFEKLTLIIAEIIVKVIEKLYGYHLEIKFPNDIVINGRKLRGNSY